MTNRPTKWLTNQLTNQTTDWQTRLQIFTSNKSRRSRSILDVKRYWRYFILGREAFENGATQVEIQVNKLFYMIQGVHKILCFLPKILKYSGLWPFSVFPRCQFVYTQQAGRKPALLQQNLQCSEKSQNVKEKTQYLMHTCTCKSIPMD